MNSNGTPAVDASALLVVFPESRHARVLPDPGQPGGRKHCSSLVLMTNQNYRTIVNGAGVSNSARADGLGAHLHIVLLSPHKLSTSGIASFARKCKLSFRGVARPFITGLTMKHESCLRFNGLAVGDCCKYGVCPMKLTLRQKVLRIADRYSARWTV